MTKEELYLNARIGYAVNGKECSKEEYEDRRFTGEWVEVVQAGSTQKWRTSNLLALVIAYCVILIFLSLILGLSGCASAPVVTESIGTIDLQAKGVPEAPKLPEGCTQATLAQPGDQYSYQGDIDPQTIYNEWVEVPKLREGDYRMGAMCYKNPDFNADITAAELVMQAGVCAAFCYLQDGEPRAFVYDPASACYVEMEMDGGQRKEFIDRLLVILYINSKAI